MSDLKPCPFCGERGKIEVASEVNQKTRKVDMAYGVCIYCDACGPVSDGDDAPIEAENAWNTRPEEDRLRSEVAELVKALRDIRDDAWEVISMSASPRTRLSNYGQTLEAIMDNAAATLSKHEDK